MAVLTAQAGSACAAHAVAPARQRSALLSERRYAHLPRRGGRRAGATPRRALKRSNACQRGAPRRAPPLPHAWPRDARGVAEDASSLGGA